jgi:hypothetical protein
MYEDVDVHQCHCQKDIRPARGIEYTVKSTRMQLLGRVVCHQKSSQSASPIVQNPYELS